MLTISLVLPTLGILAESREAASTPDDLFRQSSVVFEGTVLQIEAVPTCKVSFPIKAKVSWAIKGKLNRGELSFKYKSPGKFVILEQEYNAPKIGQKGTFYLRDMGGTLVLIGYIKAADPRPDGDGLKPAP